MTRSTNLRRRKLLFAGSGIAALGSSVLGALWFANSAEDLVENAVRRNLPDLEISNEDMQRFVADFLQFSQIDDWKKIAAMRLLTPFAERPAFGFLLFRKIRSGFANYDRVVMTEFIMGSDFLSTYALGTPRVRYYSIFDPRTAPCTNPLYHSTNRQEGIG